MARQLHQQLTTGGRVAAVAVAVVLMAAAGCTSPRAKPAPASTQTSRSADPGYRVVRTLPHDPQAFTQGLVIVGGALFESTGQRGSGSSIRKIDLKTGRVVRKVAVRPGVFAEGIAAHDGRLYQLTLQNHTIFLYDQQLEALGERRFEHEAWGLTSDASHLILSDGTSNLTVLRPSTLATVRTLRVRDANGPIEGLNELERVGDDVLANVFGSPRIARIDLTTGRVSAWLDLSAIVRAVGATDEEAVLNGIAIDPASGHLYVTGKLWPTIYELELTAN